MEGESETASEARRRDEAAREVLKPTPVKSGRVPAFIKTAVTSIAKQRSIRLDAGMSPLSRLQRVLNEFHPRAGSYPTLDHWGTTDFRGSTAFVSEPYSTNGGCLSAWEAFAVAAGLGFRLDANSWHAPGSTIRLMLYEKLADRT